MNFLMYLKKLKNYFLSFFFVRRNPKISLLIPFSSKDAERNSIFKWVLEYWRYELPDAEIVIGHSKSDVFCKGEALNDAARRAKGEVLVVIDADAYISGRVINYCADRILQSQHHLWYVP